MIVEEVEDFWDNKKSQPLNKNEDKKIEDDTASLQDDEGSDNVRMSSPTNISASSSRTDPFHSESELHAGSQAFEHEKNRSVDDYSAEYIAGIQSIIMNSDVASRNTLILPEEFIDTIEEPKRSISTTEIPRHQLSIKSISSRVDKDQNPILQRTWSKGNEGLLEKSELHITDEQPSRYKSEIINDLEIKSIPDKALISQMSMQQIEAVEESQIPDFERTSKAVVTTISRSNSFGEDSRVNSELALPKLNSGLCVDSSPIQKNKNKSKGLKSIVANARAFSPFRRKSKNNEDDDDSALDSPKSFDNLSSVQDTIKTINLAENSNTKLQDKTTGLERNTNSLIELNKGQIKEQDPVPIPFNQWVGPRSDLAKSEQDATIRAAWISPRNTNPPGGCTVGPPNSGVLLEGWLRQKQRKGVKGIKKWHDRYFVFYKKLKEIRYYTDVTVSAWGPIPLGEIGAISLRLIRKITTPSHPKYKGCRFDITCLTSWGTHYADDYIPSDDDDEDPSLQETRNYSLLADSPQIRATWLNIIEAALKTNQESAPVPKLSKNDKNDKETKKSISKDGMQHIKNGMNLKITNDRDIPHLVTLAVEYLESSTPGIEMERLYSANGSPSNVMKAKQYFSGLEGLSELKSPPKQAIDEYLDPVTVGSIVKEWLMEMKSPIIPEELYDTFLDVLDHLPQAPYAMIRDLQNLVASLPEKNLLQLEFLVFHLASVAEYSSGNKMTCSYLSNYFTQGILRPVANKNETSEAAKKVVEHLIANVDSIFS